MIEERLKLAIRDVPDFPKPGIMFKDITPIMLDSTLSNDLVNHLSAKYEDKEIDAVAGIESRGFLLGYPLAMKLGVPFILIRKKGKLPANTISQSYDLEYGTAELEVHTDAVKKGMKVLVHDDLLATGGSANAAGQLLLKCGAQIAGFDFMVGLDFLKGKEKLMPLSSNINTTINY